MIIPNIDDQDIDCETEILEVIVAQRQIVLLLEIETKQHKDKTVYQLCIVQLAESFCAHLDDPCVKDGTWTTVACFDNREEAIQETFNTAREALDADEVF